jgi:transposase-like protein
MTNPFRYFNSSPEVIRLVVMMYVRYPLSLRNVEDLLAERGIEHQLRDRPVLVEPVWSDVRRRDPQKTRRAHARLSSVAVAFG